MCARPCKSVATMSKHFTKEELQTRQEQEKRLKGLADNIKPPAYLSKTQKKIFKYIVQELKVSGILCNLDIYVLTTCSIAIDRLQDIETLINKDINNLYNKDLMASKDKYTKDLFRCTSELSLSPQSRAKLGNLNLQVKKDEEDPVKKALRGDTE
ncbi:phage terminase small subunit P27 family [Clostridium sp. P21]|uniref:Phage terminase small subunit P27 family n=1 Tax=Clostridium muellerianum TaxID=2716538 RepID=A0A7Y0ELT7_9CLOT|nr:phage terminase small subunit P27 family [Clostridium muellerianum]NMM65487.1 phage terminase small subunit P27 family [Clostridium muellerianum]